MNEPESLVICLSTVASKHDAEKIAELMLDQSLAACVQIEGPITSHYVWQGKRHSDEEYRLVIKTSSAAWASLKSTLSEIHPYDEPQIMMWVVNDSTPGYRDWVITQAKGRSNETMGGD